VDWMTFIHPFEPLCHQGIEPLFPSERFISATTECFYGGGEI